MKRLGVNIDHIATVRMLRQTPYPDIGEAAKLAIQGGADWITVHLREDRRHIQDADVHLLGELGFPFNLEMAPTTEMVAFACRFCPQLVTLVPERRSEQTTESGLDVAALQSTLESMVTELRTYGMAVSVFIDPWPHQVVAAHKVGATMIEFHTGAYANSRGDEQAETLKALREAARVAQTLKLSVAAGHGLHYQNIGRLVREVPDIAEYNIGHAIVSRALAVGLERAVREMKAFMEVI